MNGRNMDNCVYVWAGWGGVRYRRFGIDGYTGRSNIQIKIRNLA
jgi:hypothetical protein